MGVIFACPYENGHVSQAMHGTFALIGVALNDPHEKNYSLSI